MLACSFNACISLLNQAAIAQIEAPVAALTVAMDPQTRTFRTDVHKAGDELIDMVVGVPDAAGSAGGELRFLMLTTNSRSRIANTGRESGDQVMLEDSADAGMGCFEALMSSKFEQVARQTANQIIETTYS